MRLDLGQVGPNPFAASVGRLAPEHASITTGAAPMHLDDDDARDDSRDARASDDARDDAPGDAPDDAPDARDNASPREKRAYGGSTEEIAARKEAREAKRNKARRDGRAATAAARAQL
jgi:hypothetical protein